MGKVWSIYTFLVTKRIALITAVVCFVVGCVDTRSKEKFFGKNLVCDKTLWREKYRVFSGGAYSAELYSDYVTDSVNFKIYIGTHDEHSNFDYACYGDTLFVKKLSIKDGALKVIEKQMTYKLSDLRAQKKFE